MILLILLMWCFIGAFAAGMVFELSDKAIDSVGIVLMTVFAPITVLCLVGYLAVTLGQKIVKVIRGA